MNQCSQLTKSRLIIELNYTKPYKISVITGFTECLMKTILLSICDSLYNLQALYFYFT